MKLYLNTVIFYKEMLKIFHFLFLKNTGVLKIIKFHRKYVSPVIHSSPAVGVIQQIVVNRH